ncbi:hypothetical protein J6590_076665, partial [Homalodisca vitripennis]
VLWAEAISRGHALAARHGLQCERVTRRVAFSEGLPIRESSRVQSVLYGRALRSESAGTCGAGPNCTPTPLWVSQQSVSGRVWSEVLLVVRIQGSGHE